jgi:hypothetical protein
MSSRRGRRTAATRDGYCPPQRARQEGALAPATALAAFLTVVPNGKVPADPVRAIDELWKPISKEQLERRMAGKPLTHRLVRLPHVSKRTKRILGPLNGMLVDG